MLRPRFDVKLLKSKYIVDSKTSYPVYCCEMMKMIDYCNITVIYLFMVEFMFIYEHFFLLLLHRFNICKIV